MAELFFTFMKIGLFTFGGGYAMISLIEDICVERRRWITHEEMMNLTVVAESTPGPIMVNMATYIGSSQGGFWGAVLATAAVVLPSFCIILLVMVLLKTLLDHPYAQGVLRGLKPCVIGIILATGAEMVLSNCLPAAAPDRKAIALTAVLAAVLFGSRYLRKKKLSPIALICIAAVLGIAVYGI